MKLPKIPAPMMTRKLMPKALTDILMASSRDLPCILPLMTMKTRQMKQPMAAASLVLKMPAIMPPMTTPNRMMALIKPFRAWMRSFQVTSYFPGAREGFFLTQRTIVTMNTMASRMPGITPEMNIFPMETSATAPYRIIWELGGIRKPRGPPAATQPVDSLSS